MSVKKGIHELILELEQGPPEKAPIGSTARLKVKLSCAEGCDLTDAQVRLMSGEEQVSIHNCETGELGFTAPEQLGTYSWTLVYPRQEFQGTVHEEVSVPVSFSTEALKGSLAVWDVPSPVVTGEKFRIKVGARSSEGCSLGLARVEILDSQGTAVGGGTLGEEPWQGTSALYWTEVELCAPESEGQTMWSARFPEQELPLAHLEGKAEFSFVTVKKPEHKLTVSIVGQNTAEPIEGVLVRLGPFRSATDATGTTELLLPKGSYEVAVWHPKFECPATRIEITGNTSIQLPVTPVPEDDPDAQWYM